MFKINSLRKYVKHYTLHFLILLVVSLLANVSYQASSPRGFLGRRLLPSASVNNPTILQPFTNSINNRYLILRSDIYQRQNNTFDAGLYDRNNNLLTHEFDNYPLHPDKDYPYPSSATTGKDLCEKQIIMPDQSPSVFASINDIYNQVPQTCESTEKHHATNPKQKEKALNDKRKIVKTTNAPLTKSIDSKKNIPNPSSVSNDAITISKRQTDIQRKLSKITTELDKLKNGLKEEQQKSHKQNVQSASKYDLLYQNIHQLEEKQKAYATTKETIENNQNILHQLNETIEILDQEIEKVYEYKSIIEKKQRRWESRMTSIAVMYWLMLFLSYPIKIIFCKISVQLMKSICKNSSSV